MTRPLHHAADKSKTTPLPKCSMLQRCQAGICVAQFSLFARPPPAALLRPLNIEYEGPGEYKPRSMTCKHLRRLLRTFFRQQSPKSGSYGESLTHHACACAHRIIRPSCALRTSLPMSLPRKFQTAVNAWARLLMPKRMPCRCVQEPLDLFLVQPISPPLHSRAFNVAAFGSPLENAGCRPISPIRPIPDQSHTKSRLIPLIPLILISK